MLSNILLSRLSLYVDEIIGDFDMQAQLFINSFCIYQILEKWEYNETVHQLFIDLKNEILWFS
jgi:hypothetical protein